MQNGNQQQQPFAMPQSYGPAMPQPIARPAGMPGTDQIPHGGVNPAMQAFQPDPVAPQQPQIQQAYAPQPGQPAPVFANVPVTGGGQPAAAPAAPRTNTNSTQNTLQIAEIRDGIVIMNDGSFRSVLMVKSINFDLMSQGEQEAVEYSYQGFLNSLYFPIQIFIRSQKVDLQPYVDKLDKIRTEHDNMLLAVLMEDYINYIEQLGDQTNIMDKKFYIVIPYFPHVDVQKALTNSKNFVSGIGALFSKQDTHVTINEDELEKAKTELRNRVQACLSGLLQCGVQGLPLDTQELIELYYDWYNPDTATRQQLKNFNQLSADVVTKGEGMAPQVHLQRELN